MFARRLINVAPRPAVGGMPWQAVARPAACYMSTSPSKLIAPPMTYIAGEEMTAYAMRLILDKWINPHIDTSKWEYYDLSCVSRDDSEDQCLRDAVESGARLGAIFKEPTVTPTEVQKKKLGLKKSWGSPNGAMRKGWNGITISRDTIHIEGMQLGFKRPVLFERHAVGGEYGAGWKSVGKGKLVTTFFPDDEDKDCTIVDSRTLTDDEGVAVVYHNPLDNVKDLAHIFFNRCLEGKVTPYVVTKKTVFKWQEGFWVIMKDIFDAEYKQKYLDAGLLDNCGGELQHLISDAATMQIIRWTDGGFGMACHNYDGDMLTDEVAQVHRSPGFITSNLVGKSADGSLIKEFEASHGTVADLWDMHNRGEETSLNPLGMVEALIGAMQHAATLDKTGSAEDNEAIIKFTADIRTYCHKAMSGGMGTRDLSGPSGLTTEAFIDYIAQMIETKGQPPIVVAEEVKPDRRFRRNYQVDEESMKAMFKDFDKDDSGHIDFEEFCAMLVRLNIAPEIRVAGDEKEE